MEKMQKIPKVLLLIESSRASGRALLLGIAEYARYHGPWSFLWEPGGLEKVSGRLKEFKPDGAILRDTENLDEVMKLKVPLIIIGHKRPEIPNFVNVVTDSEKIGKMAAEHLLECGFKNFGYCGILMGQGYEPPWSILRRQAFFAKVKEAGHRCYDFFDQFPHPHSSRTAAINALCKWLKKLPKPVGIMACNDDRAQQVAEACKLCGIAVPDEVGIIGVDNDEVVCGLTDPPLSSVAVNFFRAGAEAAAALQALMQRLTPPNTRIIAPATHIVVRRSTDFVAASDQFVAKALRFIRDTGWNAKISVSDVVQAAGTSRRNLEKRFRTELGHSILAELKYVRGEKIANMLVETNLPIAKIAECLGFEDVQHFARYFKSIKGLTPLAYRKKFGKALT